MPTVFSRTQRERLRDTTNAKIRELMIDITSSPLLLYQVVAGGPVYFRQNFLRSFSGLAVDDHIANLVFAFFCEKVVKRHQEAAQAGESAKLIASRVLDKVEITSPPTEREIEESWVHEVASVEGGRREFYKDGAGMAGQDHKVIIR